MVLLSKTLKLIYLIEYQASNVASSFDLVYDLDF